MSELLPDELVWADGGHASDVVLTAIADGEESIVPEVARRHVHQCVHCTQALGRVAVLSLHVHDEIEHVRPIAAELSAPAPAKVLRIEAHEPARWKLPWPALAAALVLAAVGSIPTLLDAPQGVATGTRAAVTNLPLALRHVTVAARAAGDAGEVALVVNVGTALLMITMAALIARRVLRSGAQGVR